MSNPQQNLYLDFKNTFSSISITVSKDGRWYWLCEGGRKNSYWSENYFNSAADAEQDLITFLKNYEGFRNG
jgi:hypothetical protein